MSLRSSDLLAPYADAFQTAAGDYDIVPVAVELHVDSVTPVALVESFTRNGGFLLESVEDGARFGRFSFVGRKALGHYVQDVDGIRSSGQLADIGGKQALDAASSVLRDLRIAPAVGSSVDQIPLTSGLVGVFGWDCIREVEALPPMAAAGAGQPIAAFDLIGDLVAFDHWRQSCTIILSVAVQQRDAAAAWAEVHERLDGVLDALHTPLQPYVRPHRGRHDMPMASSTRTVSSETFQWMVREAKEQIAAGEVFQIVLSQRFDVGLVEDPLEVYRVLRQMNPSAYLYYLRFPDCVVVGSSPEALVRVRQGQAVTRPIAGSRPRSDNERENELRASALREDPKEIAEHIMLVDLGRNDIGRIATYGSVRVDELMTVEHYSHIMHLTSQVSGTVREGVDAVDVLRATFPAGTLSGAPKVRAMELITEMEPEQRGLYGGAVGYFDARGNFDAAILIRTLVVNREGQGSVQTGAGIVWDSDPVAEDEECQAKAEAVLRAVGGARS